MKMNRLYCIIGLAFVFFRNVDAQTFTSDSILQDNNINGRKFRIDGFMATSFLINVNWKEMDNSSIMFYGSLNLTYKKSGERLKRIQELRSELSYLKYLDSTWIKNADNFFLSSIWMISMRGGVRNSFSLNLKTQLTDTWEENYSGPGKNRKWHSGPLIPLTFILGYGINWTFLNESYLNISLASVKINSRPMTNNIQPELKIVARTDKIFFTSEYGVNIQSSINKKLLRKILWENKISFFTTGPDKKEITFEIQNIISIKPFRFFKIRLENKMVYDFLISDKIQFRHELLLGYSLEKN